MSNPVYFRRSSCFVGHVDTRNEPSATRSMLYKWDDYYDGSINARKRVQTTNNDNAYTEAEFTNSETPLKRPGHYPFRA